MSTGLILVTVLVFQGTTTVSAAVIGLRVRFGLHDERPTNWNGTVEVSPGGLTHISGWRFAKGDSIDGMAGWKALTYPLARPAAELGRSLTASVTSTEASKVEMLLDDRQDCQFWD